MIVIVGMNKLTRTVMDAANRARTEAAPINAQRFASLKTPCQIDGMCHDCNSPDSICVILSAPDGASRLNGLKSF